MAKSFELELTEERAVARIQAMVLRLLDAKKITRSELAKKMDVSAARVSQLLGEEPENLSVRKAAALFFALGEQLQFTCNGIEELDRIAQERRDAKASTFDEVDHSCRWTVANGNDVCGGYERDLVAA